MNLKKACRISIVIDVIIAILILLGVWFIGDPYPETRPIFEKLLEFYYLLLLVPVGLSLVHNIQHKKNIKEELYEDDNWD